MTALRIAIAVIWLVFWGYWLISARGVKVGIRGSFGVRFRLITLVAVLILARLVRVRALAVHSLPLAGVGAALVVAGLGLAVWARIHLGRNWGMPMSRSRSPSWSVPGRTGWCVTRSTPDS